MLDRLQEFEERMVNQESNSPEETKKSNVLRDDSHASIESEYEDDDSDDDNDDPNLPELDPNFDPASIAITNILTKDNVVQSTRDFFLEATFPGSSDYTDYLNWRQASQPLPDVTRELFAGHINFTKEYQRELDRRQKEYGDQEEWYWE